MSWQDQLAELVQQYTKNFAWPVSKDLNPGGWPIPAVPFANGLASALMQIPGMSPALAGALAWATFHTLMIFWPLGQQAVQLAISLAPALVAVPGAGAAVPVAAASSLPAVVAATVGAMPTPVTAAAAPASASSAATVPAPATTGPTLAIGGGPVGGGPEVGFSPSASTGVGAGVSDVLYAVGLSGLSARGSATTRVRRKSEEPAPGDVDAAAPGATDQRVRSRRRRGATATDRAYRYEFMDLKQGPDQGFDGIDPNAARPSDQGRESVGFAGAAARSDVRGPAGLTTLTGPGLNDAPTWPLLSGSWGGHANMAD